MNLAIKSYMDYLLNEKNYSPRTVDSSKYDLEKFFSFLADEGYLMNEVDVLVIRNFLTDELTNGISKRSCKRRLSTLRHFYDYMVKTKQVEENPFIFIDSPKIEKKFNISDK